jgi:hypothetical protein
VHEDTLSTVVVVVVIVVVVFVIVARIPPTRSNRRVECRDYKEVFDKECN